MDHSLDLERLLAQESLIRRLARDLVRDEAGADDLTQDVLLTAIEQRPRLRGAQLYAWLRTVTRRTASQRRSQEATRARAEHGASRPEAIEGDARARLALHRRLNEAIDELPPLYRTALVLRYLEELPPREIAVRLNVSVIVARKRVSRGLELLRQRLDGEFGSRTTWLQAFAPIVKVDGAKAVASTAWTVAGTLTMKKIICLGIALVACLSWAVWSPASKARALEAEVGLLQPVDIAQASAPGARSASIPLRATERRKVGLQAPTSAPDEPRLLVTDPGGTPLPSAQVDWIDPAGVVHELDLDARATALKPRAGFVLAQHAGFALVHAALSEDEADLTLTLRAVQALEGRVLVDDSPPRTSVLVMRRSFTNEALPAPIRRAVRNGMLAGPPEFDEVQTLPDGTFRFDAVDTEEKGLVFLLDSFRSPLDGQLAGKSYTMPATPTIRATRLPYLTGRAVWADDGSPIRGRLDIRLHEPESGGSLHTSRIMGLDGRFEVGFHVQDRGSESSRLFYSRVDIFARPEAERAIEAWYPFELDVGGLPLDVGELRFERAREIEFLVLDDANRPIVSALVIANYEHATTDIRGRAALKLSPNDDFHILAEGFELLTMRHDDLPENEAGLRFVSLQPGVTLSLKSAPSSKSGLSEEAGTVRISQAVDNDAHHRHSALIHHAQTASHLTPRPSVSFLGGDPTVVQVEVALGGQPIELHGFRTGETLEVSSLDALGRVLNTQPVQLPAMPGSFDVDVDLQTGSSGELTVRFVDSKARAVPNVEVKVLGSGIASKRWKVEDGTIEFAPLLPGQYDFRASAEGHVAQAFPIDFQGGSILRTMTMETGRSLHVSLEPLATHSFAPSYVYVEVGPDWSSNRQRPKQGETATFVGVPKGTAVVVARFGTLEERHAVPVDAESFTLPLPDIGYLFVRLEERPRLAARLQLNVMALNPDSSRAATQISPHGQDSPAGFARQTRALHADAVGPIAMGFPLPRGMHRVSLELVEGPADDQTTTVLIDEEIEIRTGIEVRLDVP